MSRPFVSLKLATSLDGKIALGNSVSKWITGEKSRERGRELRASHDAILIGSNTALADNPFLTTRIKRKKDPIRIVFDRRLRLPIESNLAMTAREVPVWVFTKELSSSRSETLKEKGVCFFNAAETLDADLFSMCENGVDRLLIEGGGTIAASFLDAGLVDEIHWFRAPIILGGDGRSCIGDMNLSGLEEAPVFRRKFHEMIEQDSYNILERIA
ncbi:MAG: RibD family protein [Hellea sp.]|nr:RibD family protein [Hellea sp.]